MRGVAAGSGIQQTMARAIAAARVRMFMGRGQEMAMWGNAPHDSVISANCLAVKEKGLGD
jgi:hypothetical protein